MEKENNFSYELNSVLNYMTDVLGLEYPTDVYGSEYLIVSMLDMVKCRANMILDNCLMSNDMVELRNIYISHIIENTKPTAKHKDGKNENKGVFGETLNNILTLAVDEAKRFRSQNVGSDHVLLSMLNPKNNFKVHEVFQSMGVNYAMIIRKCETLQATTKKPNKILKTDKSGLINSNGGAILTKSNNAISGGSHEYIDRFTVNLNKKVSEGTSESLIGRDSEINQIIKVFSRKRKNNVILVGQIGVGKTSIVYGLAERINNGEVPHSLLGREIIMLDIMALVSGTNFRGMLEDRVDNLYKELNKNNKYILFLDDVHTMLRSRNKEKDTDISGIIGNILNSENIQVIAATNDKEFRNTVENNPSVAKRLQRINVEANTSEEAIEILNGIKGKYEMFHNVHYSPDVIEKIVLLSERYIPSSCLPDSAIDIMDSAGAYVSLKSDDSKDIYELKQRLDEIQTEKQEILNNGEFEKLTAITLEEEAINAEMDELNKGVKTDKVGEVTEDDVALVVSEMTSVPITRLNANDKRNIAKINETLKKSIVGQDEAIDAICRSIKRNRVGLGYKSATKGIYLTLGPSGCGKTILAKKIAEEIYGDEKALIRLDMSEYSEKNSVSKLYGSAPGYVGYENGGQLTEAVKNKPYSVILLDEIEKADPDVYNVFLQLFDEGRMTDSSGQLVNFKNCIIIMTSNIGVKQASEMGNGIGFNADGEINKKSTIEKQLKGKFPPEFLNRIDKIIYFNTLTDDNLKDIIHLEINKLNTRLQEMKYSFTFDDKVVDYIHSLAKKQKEYGARPIIRLIQEYIEDNITDLLLTNDYHPDYVFSGTCVNDKIVIK